MFYNRERRQHSYIKYNLLLLLPYSKDNRRRLNCIYRGQRVRIFGGHLLLWIKIFPDSHAINVATPLSGMSSTQILVVTPPPDFYLDNTRGHTSFQHAIHAVYAAFYPRTPASCLLQVPGAFPVIFVHPGCDCRCCIDIN